MKCIFLKFISVLNSITYMEYMYIHNIDIFIYMNKYIYINIYIYIYKYYIRNLGLCIFVRLSKLCKCVNMNELVNIL